MKCWACGEELKAGEDLLVSQAPWSLEPNGLFFSGEWPYVHKVCSEGLNDWSTMTEREEVMPCGGIKRTWHDSNTYRQKAHEVYMKHRRGA